MKLIELGKYLVTGITFVLLYQLAVQISARMFLIQGIEHEIVRLFFLPPALSISFILLYGKRYLPFLVVNPLYNTITNDRPLFLVITLTLSLPIIYGGAGMILRSVWMYRYNEFSLREMYKIIIVGSFAPLVNAIVIQLSFLLNQRITIDQFLPRLYEWYIGDLIGIFTLFPLIIVIYQYLDQSLHDGILRNIQTRVSIVKLVVIVLNIFLVLGVFLILWWYNLNMIYILFLPIAIIAIMTNSSFTILVTSINSLFFSYLISISSYQYRVPELQGYMVASIIFALFLASAIEDKKRSEEQLKIEERVRFENNKFINLGKLAQGISHDLNNALTVLNGQIQLLELEEDIDQRPIERLSKSVELISNLNDQLQSIGHFQKLDNEIINLNEILRSMRPALENLMKKGIEFEITLEPELPNIKANRSQIKQIILNLVVNAVEATSTGKIIVQTYSDDEIPYLMVKDSGSGIPKEIRNKVFEMLVSSKQNSSGFGLWIVHEIISKIQGNISIETQEGVGTTFIIEFQPYFESSHNEGQKNNWLYQVNKKISN